MRLALVFTLALVLTTFNSVWAQKYPQLPQIKIPTMQLPKIPDPLGDFLSKYDPYYYRELTEQAAQDAQKESKSVESVVAKLLDEFGPNARYAVTEHFIFIYDTTNYYASWTALLFERVENVYEHFARYMRFGMTDLSEPMVVLIFSNKENFEAYASKEDPLFKKLANKPVGFYSSGNNRATLFDITGVDKTVDEIELAKTKKHIKIADIAKEILSLPKGEETMTTFVHEATHQVSYNRGLFNRQGKNPDWAVEGLAMLFEAPVGKVEDGGWNVTTDFGPNKRRIREFKQYLATNPGNPLRSIVSAEDVNGDVKGSYEVSWALFSYLYKLYPKLLAQYLYGTALQQRDTYTVSQRIAEFEYCFTSDWDGLWASVCEFVDALEKNPDAFMSQPEEKKKKEEGNKAKSENKKENAAKTNEQAETPKDDSVKENVAKENAANDFFTDDSDDADEKDAKKESKKETQASNEKSGDSEKKQDAKLNDKSEGEKTAETKPSVEKSKEEPVVSVEGVALDGKPLDWSAYKGKYVLVNFWATWNKEARAEAPKLVELYERYHDSGLEIVGVSQDDAVKTIEDFVAKNKITWQVVSAELSKDYPNMSERFGVYRLPETILVGKDGKRISDKGADGKTIRWNLEKLEGKLKELMPDAN